VVEAGRDDPFGQSDCGARFEWGPTGAARGAGHAACLVVVDVLSFTTSVSVCVARGTAVVPHRWGDPEAAAFAAEHQAELAVRRREVSAEHPWSLSPAVLRHAPATPRLVLPSPNGSTIAAAASTTSSVPSRTPTTVVAACLRNARAVGAWLGAQGYGTSALPVLVVAAGERWPDGSLRPALEDALGAGAVLGHLRAAGRSLSPEASAVAAMVEGTPDMEGALRACGSARQLVAAGYGGDVEVAAEIDGDATVPVIEHGAFIDRSFD
jgi:2-phosphosulfolactate phosphatase